MGVLTENDLLRLCSDDAEHAQGLVDTGQKLPWWAWCALVGDLTGLPTCRYVTNSAGGIVGIATGREWGLNNVPNRVIQYVFPGEIARQGSKWDNASGGQMASWALLLAEPSEIDSALRANRRRFEGDIPDLSETEQREAVARVFRVIRQMAGSGRLPYRSEDIAERDREYVAPVIEDDVTRMAKRMRQLEAENELLRRSAERQTTKAGV